jgi:uncharacterized protein YdhG (YjbR/CyaY superfamily)
MVGKDPKRESYFPAIEKKYGKKMSYWFTVMKKVADKRYPEQMAYLQENFGFSRSHANALVMYSRGSLSARRFSNITEYYQDLPTQQAKTIRLILKTLREKYPDLQLVIAWNTPVLKLDQSYIFGVGALKNHILINPFTPEVIEFIRPKIGDLRVNKHTIAIPNDWEIDNKLLFTLVKARIAQVKNKLI